MLHYKPGHCICIAWAPHSRRSESLAHELGAKLYLIHYLKFQKPAYAPLKYILQSFKTLQVLLSERPEVVLVQNPPFVCSLIVYLYGFVSKTRFALDHHSAAFARIWDWALPIQKSLARSAETNIVTNRHWVDIIQSWMADALIMGDPFLSLVGDPSFPVQSGFNLAVINTFAPDEPIDVILNAAKSCADVNFYFTGNTKRKPESFFDDLPGNVIFTGFLPDNEYVGLLNAVDAVVALTTRNHTLQLGGCEAVSAGKPLITSNWPYLQDFFAGGSVYVEPKSADSIVAGIRLLQQKYTSLHVEMLSYRQEKRLEWDRQLDQLKEVLALSS